MKTPSQKSVPSCDVIASRLREHMQARGLNSAQLARRAGIKTSFLYDVLRGKSHNPSVVRLSKVADVLGVPLSCLIETERSQNADTPLAVAPLVPAQAPAACLPAISFNPEWLEQQQIGKPQHLRLFIIEGDSMQPTLCAQDVVLIDTKKTVPSPPGIFMLLDKGKMVARRLEQKIHKGQHVMCLLFDNLAYSSEKRDPEDIAILGRVVWTSRRL